MIKQIYNFYQKVYKVFTGNRHTFVCVVFIFWFVVAMAFSCKTENSIHFQIWFSVLFIVLFGRIMQLFK